MLNSFGIGTTNKQHNIETTNTDWFIHETKFNFKYQNFVILQRAYKTHICGFCYEKSLLFRGGAEKFRFRYSFSKQERWDVTLTNFWGSRTLWDDDPKPFQRWHCKSAENCFVTSPTPRPTRWMCVRKKVRPLKCVLLRRWKVIEISRRHPEVKH